MTRTEDIAHAREVDTRIAAAWQEYYEASSKLLMLHKDLDSSKVWLARGYKSYEARIERHTADIEALKPTVTALREAAVKLDADEYKGWSRFFLVKHIHKDQYCSSFRPTTQVGWLPEVSGLTEAEAVAEHGAILCTICFPSAPVEWTRGKDDPDKCAGSGQPINYALPGAFDYYSGNWATCSTCNKEVGIRRGAVTVAKHKPLITNA